MENNKMKVSENIITAAHGGGGLVARELIKSLFVKHFASDQLNKMGDSALISLKDKRAAFTTDAFVVKPLFFKGGDIGRLSICGTVNDICCAGASPVAISAGFIIEEGFSIADLEKIVVSMANAAKDAGVCVVAGDTKVVERGKCDGVFICTSGMGDIYAKREMSPESIMAGDAILINGSIADHGMAIMCERSGIGLSAEIQSDCAPLAELAKIIYDAAPSLRFMRDATRGGLAAVLCEACEGAAFGIEVDEKNIPICETTASACEILGLDPLHVANEGKLVSFVAPDEANAAVKAMRAHPLGRKAAVIGKTTKFSPAKVSLVTSIGTRRLITQPYGDELPRIC